MKLLFFLALFTYTLPTRSNAQNASQFDGYPTVKSALNKKIWITSKNYYLITKASDSTVHLYWGNDSFKRKYNTDFDLSSAEKLEVKWTNKNYLILEYGTGSGVWVDIAFPIDKTEKPQEFVNGVCFDRTSNLFVSEGYDDTILIVKNLKTKKQQFIIDKEHRCGSYSNNNCLGAVEIKNEFIYFNWAVPINGNDTKEKLYKKK